MNQDTVIKKPIPITIFTGFLGSGKTTIVNHIIDQNSQNGDRVFGVIVNEFGEVGVDNEILHTDKDEVVELSNGCMCCIVRSDLYSATQKLLEANPKINYLIIEASGLAEPKPIADTYIMNTLDGAVYLDSICCVVDVQNHTFTSKQYKVALEQIQYSDFVLLNKVDKSVPQSEIDTLKKAIKKINPPVIILENTETNPINYTHLIDQQVWDEKRLESIKQDPHTHNSHHGHHHHEHDDFDEVVYVSKPHTVFDPHKLDEWLKTTFPQECVRAKGLMRIDTSGKEQMFIFQMVGAAKTLSPFTPSHDTVDMTFSRVVFIGKGLNKTSICDDLNNCMI